MTSKGNRMRLYNTLLKKIDDFRPIHEGQAAIYSCGPTVYDHIHIGNLSAFIYADTLRRALSANGFLVKHVMNFTDVDDKTIRRSQEKYPALEPMPALRKLTEEYAAVFLDDMAAVGNDTEAFRFVKATDSIQAMQSLIRELHGHGYAYVTDDGVYFSIKAYKDSGKVYGQLTEITEASTSEARIANDEYDKASPHDFALWKKQKDGEPAWDFELDGQDLRGRPGWHIECSAMSTTELGQPFDIHTGGVDLVFPHHENEIAQSTAGRNEAYANCFVHNEHLLVDGNKMSKSLRNFHTLQDIVDKGHDPLAFRMLVLQSHYRNQAHFSWDNLHAAESRLQDFRAMAALRWQTRENLPAAGTVALSDAPAQLKRFVADDLSSPAALAFISDVSDHLQQTLIAAGNSEQSNNLADFNEFLETVDALFGLQLLAVGDISDEQKAILAEREQARSGKNWEHSDELRARLQDQGIGLRDTTQGPIWFPL